MGADDTPMVPSTQQISQLRNDLRVLATQADEFQLSQIEDLENEFSVRREWKLEQTAPSSFEETESSGSSNQSLESPLAFLQGLLPHIPVHEIIAALEDSEKSGKEFDMWELVSTLLSELAIKDLEERGSAGLDVDGDHHELDWDTVAAKKSTKQRGNHRSPTKVALFDVRQTRHIRAAGADRRRDIAAPDPWTQVNSLATRLSELLPSHSAPFFSSYFHNPTHRSPYVACRAALTTICEKQKSKSEIDAAVIVTILELAYPDYQELDGEQQTRLLSDIELSVQVTRGRFDDCLSIIDILVVLNFDANNNYLEMGVYHLSPKNSSPAKAIAVPASTNATLNSSVASKLPPPSSPPIPTKPPSYKEKPPPDKNKPSPFQWQAVPQKNKSEFTPHPLAVHIPAYARDVNGIKVKGAGGGNGRKGSVGGRYMTARLGGSVSQTSAVLLADHKKKYKGYLMEASKMWQRGNAKNRGGEAASYYAERVSDLGEQVVATCHKEFSVEPGVVLMESCLCSHRRGSSKN